MLKHKLKPWSQKALANKGFELRRSPSTDVLYNSKHLSTAGKIFEFVGPSGGGKTTLLTHMEKQLTRRWYAPYSRRLLDRTADETVMSAHRKILVAKTQRIERDGLDAWEQSEILIRLGKIMHQSLAGASGVYSRGLVLDEGICHYFAEQILEQEKSIAYALLKNRYLVLLLARSPKTVASQMLKRMTEAENRTLSDKEMGYLCSDFLLENIAQQLDIYRNLGKLAKNCGCQVLTIYSEDGIKKNIQRILEFERTI
ncbi:MAG: hypothetical protein ABJZ69_03035 [Hyphomicrobiales bacterium]